LNRAEKLRVMQHLATELKREDEAQLPAETEYPIWSPYLDFEAANVLLAALAADKAAGH
jgi:hypothetical protein